MAGDAPGQGRRSLARALLRPFGWPFRRVLDPRFGGLAAQIDSKQVDLFARLAALREEQLQLHHELVHRLDEIERAAGRSNDDDLARLLDDHARATEQVATAIGRSLDLARSELREATPTLPQLTGSRIELELRSRALSAVMPVSDATVVCRLLGRYHCYIDPADWPVASSFCLDGVWEPETTIAIARRLGPGATCIDVGASYGYFTLLMADIAGPRGRVVAVEPNPPVADLLERNVLVNGFGQTASVVRSAASDIDGETSQLIVPRGRAAQASMLLEWDDNSESRDVRTTTIDDIGRELDAVDLVKIDAEGAEEAIWHGMQGTIESNAALTVVMEINVQRYRDPASFLESLQAPGFRLRHVDASGSVEDVDAARLLGERIGREWTLYLERAPAG